MGTLSQAYFFGGVYYPATDITICDIPDPGGHRIMVIHPMAIATLRLSPGIQSRQLHPGSVHGLRGGILRLDWQIILSLAGMPFVYETLHDACKTYLGTDLGAQRVVEFCQGYVFYREDGAGHNLYVTTADSFARSYWELRAQLHAGVWAFTPLGREEVTATQDLVDILSARFSAGSTGQSS